MVINSGKHAPAKWPGWRILIEYDHAQFEREFMGDKIEKLSDEELTGILKYVDPNLSFLGKSPRSGQSNMRITRMARQ